MKKILAIILSFLMIFLTACSINSPNDEKEKVKEVKKVKQKEEVTSFIPLHSPNFFTLNYKELSKKISSGISEIRGVNGYHIPGSAFKFDIYFKPNGQIIKFDGELEAQKYYNKDKFQGDIFIIENKYIESEKEILNITDTLNTDSSLVKGIQINAEMRKDIITNNQSKNNFYSNFINWFNDFNFKNILDKYVKDKPLFYKFTTNDAVLKSYIMGVPSKNITFLDCSSGKATEIKCNDIKDVKNHNECIKFNQRYFYCAFLPYYLQDGYLRGYGESSFGVYNRESEREIPSYIAKNIIIIFNDEICK